MQWIKVRTDLVEDVEVMQLADRLGVSDITMVGHLIVFWSWADGVTSNGKKLKTTFARIDKIVDLPGFSENLLKVNWLSGEDGNIKIPRFERHNGHSAKRRMQTAIRVAKHRAEKDDPKNKRYKCNAKSVTRALPDKRRGDKNNKSTSKKFLKQIETLYALYPRKLKRPLALIAIGKALQKVDYNILKTKVEAYSRSVSSEEQRFIPYPATWFNQESWGDDLSTTKKPVRGQDRPTIPREIVVAAFMAAYPRDRYPKAYPLDADINYWTMDAEDMYKLKTAYPPLQKLLEQ